MYLLTRFLALFALVLGLSVAFAWTWDQGDQRVAAAPGAKLGTAQGHP
jgi:hypothetical protein